MVKHTYPFCLDEPQIAIIKEIPKKKRSDFVRSAIELKARTLTEDQPKPLPKKQRVTIEI